MMVTCSARSVDLELFPVKPSSCRECYQTEKHLSSGVFALLFEVVIPTSSEAVRKIKSLSVTQVHQVSDQIAYVSL